MKVRLMLTCLCDAFYGEVGIAAVRVLEAAGCEVEFNARQTCCGQPPFNAGDWDASRSVAEQALAVLGQDEAPIVTPSGSCAAMIREGYRMLWPDRSFPECYEVGEFLVDKLQVGGFRSRPVTNRRKVAFHRACHGRSLGLKMQQETLLSSMPGIELVAFDQAEQCCGFGGAFSATHGKLSSGIGLEKLKQIEQSGATIIASGDMGCLMHLQGLIDRQGLKLQTRHYLELIAEEME